ncbi:Golgi-associated RAB2 interactor protein 1A-like isoform X2 [Leucoraja erinacea]|uniref:Golgi-associated RAB2 interactor protein 1A-like isoform X2 n=1 Tax=Leucoraja erinaceus TaxID=7782 RepID=UPI00245474CB|nr:Golgi-associated RAB2 interactor protein 1A-like isoform X2 [Leucoraja erinacea]
MDQSTSYRSDFFTGITEAVNSSTGSSRPSPAQLGVEGGSLHKLLRSREYNLFAQSAVFESDFIQVTRRGNLVDIHNIPTLLTLGITASVPFLPLPNILIVASRNPESKGTEGEGYMKITRMLPMKLVRLSVHAKVSRCLKLVLANRSTFYLQLQDKHPGHVFKLWEELIHIIYAGLSITFKDANINLPKSSLCDSRSSSTSVISSEKFTYDAQKPDRNIPIRSNITANTKIGVWKRNKMLVGKETHDGSDVPSSESSRCTIRSQSVSGKNNDKVSVKDWVPDTQEPHKIRTRTEQLLDVKEERSPGDEWEEIIERCSCDHCKTCNQVLTLHTLPCKQKQIGTEGEEDEEEGGGAEGDPNTFEAEDEDRTYFGLWERDRPTLMPLSRLSSLIAVGLR